MGKTQPYHIRGCSNIENVLSVFKIFNTSYKPPTQGPLCRNKQVLELQHTGQFVVPVLAFEDYVKIS
jgi:hypothetical protein